MAVGFSAAPPGGLRSTTIATAGRPCAGPVRTRVIDVGASTDRLSARANNIGALLLVRARDKSCPAACLQGLTMRRIADLASAGQDRRP